MKTYVDKPSEIVCEHVGLLAQNPVLGPVLDLACGGGRNAVFLAELGFEVEGVDVSDEALAVAAGRAREAGVTVRLRRADLESGAPGAVLPANAYSAVVVVKYLHRPLIPAIKAALRPGGIIVYETFTRRHLEIATKPANPDFLLREGELRTLFADFEPIAGFEGRRENPPRFVAAFVGRKPQ